MERWRSVRRESGLVSFIGRTLWWWMVKGALRAAERRLSVVAVCNARTLAEGRPPLGIACIQHELSHVYPLTDDPEHALADFFERAADHAHQLADQLAHQEASVERFLELSGE